MATNRVQMIVIVTIYLLSLAVVGLGVGTLVNAMQVRPYAATMMRCGEGLQLAGDHIARFASVGDAQRWADDRLASGRYDLAYIHESESSMIYQRLLLVRSMGACYDGLYRDWAAPAAAGGS